MGRRHGANRSFDEFAERISGIRCGQVNSGLVTTPQRKIVARLADYRDEFHVNYAWTDGDTASSTYHLGRKASGRYLDLETGRDQAGLPQRVVHPTNRASSHPADIPKVCLRYSPGECFI